MCIFSGMVRSVASTNIFARLSDRGTQFLVYSMRYSADHPVAMILPLPIADPALRQGIRFISFKAYADFFNDMENGFPDLMDASGPGGAIGGAAPGAAPPIHVETVGDFIASYVPTLNDFSRLDKRFTLPRSTWNKIPQYHDYGFAVFQLRPSARGETRVHPMAFEFHTRLKNILYFPTVHIHDEQVHPREDFDHALYYQDPRLRPINRPVSQPGIIGGASGYGPDGLRSSDQPASRFIEIVKTQGAVTPNLQCYKRVLVGERPNKDTLIHVA